MACIPRILLLTKNKERMKKCLLVIVIAFASLAALAQFKGTARGEQTFEVEVLPGVCTVSFVFLPGCQFDFYGFTFRQE